MTLLRVDRLSISYSDKGKNLEAVSTATFSLAFHENLAIVGESGSGKTSLAGAFLPPKARREKKISGSIYFKEKPLWEDPYPPIAFIFQDPQAALDPTMKIGHQLAEAIFENKKARYRKALSLLDEVFLPNVERIFHCYPHELSRGMLQRVNIAIALAKNAELIIADEPTTALDITTNYQILSLLQTLQEKRGFSLLLISHHLALVRTLCARTIVMHQGRIIEEGKTEDLFAHPRHPATQKLIASAHFFSHNKELPSTTQPLEAL